MGEGLSHPMIRTGDEACPTEHRAPTLPTMKHFLLLVVFLAGCSGCTVDPFGTSADDTPLAVQASNGTLETAPLFSWTPVDATSVWVTDEEGRSVWGIEAGGQSLPEGRYERVLIPSPVLYGAFTDRAESTEETPPITTPPGLLVPGTTYTVHVTNFGGGSGGFFNRRPRGRSGSATFTVAVQIGGGN